MGWWGALIAILHRVGDYSVAWKWSDHRRILALMAPVSSLHPVVVHLNNWSNYRPKKFKENPHEKNASLKAMLARNQKLNDLGKGTKTPVTEKFS